MNKTEFSHVQNIEAKMNVIDDNIIKIAELKTQFGGDDPTYCQEMNLREACREHEAFLLDQLSTAATSAAVDIARFELHHWQIMTSGEL